MDVQSAAPATTGAITGTTPATPSGDSQQVTGVVTGTQQQSGETQSSGSSTLSAVVAKLYGTSQTPQTGSGTPSSPELDVSYQVIPQLDLIVTVFTNPQTGQEVAQFPPEVLIGLAEFFDHIDGVTIDRKV
jgi:hypothetical protein